MKKKNNVLIWFAKVSKKVAIKSCSATSSYDIYQPKIPNEVRALAEKKSK